MAAPLLHVVLYQPEIPQNAGAIARSCVAARAKLWLVRPLGFHLDDRNMRRAGLDYWKHLEWEVVDDWKAVNPVPDGTRWFFSTKGKACYTQAAFRAGDVLVFGPETRGLPGSILRAHSASTLRIPMLGKVRSLNLANAASVVMFEALRQIERWPGPGPPRDQSLSGSTTGDDSLPRG